MSKKIYPKEWSATHPYKRSDASDLYYTAIANKVLNVLDSNQLDDVLNREMVRPTALALTSWFEDIISQVGIWQAFTTECKRRYGSYLPFYDTSEECSHLPKLTSQMCNFSYGTMCNRIVWIAH